MDKLVTRKEVLKLIKVHYHTLMRMVERGEIETVRMGNKRLYNLDKYLREHNLNVEEEPSKRKICYCRVSSNKQKEDLTRQIAFMRNLYPDHEIISEVGSGLNDNRKGYRKILDYAIKGEISELVVAYRDRLTRFGFDQMEYIIKKYSNGKIIVINKNIEQTPEEEITKDMLAIMNVYVAKVNGLRKYKNKMTSIIKENSYNRSNLESKS